MLQTCGSQLNPQVKISTPLPAPHICQTDLHQRPTKGSRIRVGVVAKGQKGRQLTFTLSILLSQNINHRGGSRHCNYDNHPPNMWVTSCTFLPHPSVDLSYFSSSLVYVICSSSGLAIAALCADVAEQLPLGCQAASA